MYTPMNYREIGRQLNVNEKTIKYHATYIFKQLSVRSRIDLLARALAESKDNELKITFDEPVNDILDLDALPRGTR